MEVDLQKLKSLCITYGSGVENTPLICYNKTKLYAKKR
jgi:hypothetical protein